ncbi:Rap-GAP domain-containing protein [Mycena chlorophos]|uniref:Rap-GAP domain-containing protein n=1 Tax=Mycena chlorophos TaxID=658473 RepID=A0A8H6T2B1_MYCCL|nr:Rap-GAP domain-containing protein [Mycena chlorophos]
MSSNDIDSARLSRPRANTAFSGFATWRKQQQPPSIPPAPPAPPMSVDSCIDVLTPSPTAVPSLSHARYLVNNLPTHSPLPKHTQLDPILAKLCAAESAVPLKCAGFDILAAYCENPEWTSTSSNRAAYFALFLDPSSADIWEPRFKALRSLTKAGDDTLGIEMSVLQVLKTWISDGFKPTLQDPSLERFKGVELMAGFLSSLVQKESFRARIHEEDWVGVLQFYAELAEQAMAVPRLVVASPVQEMPPPPTPRPSLSHRRNASSASLSSNHSRQANNNDRQPFDVAMSIYLTHLNNQIKLLASHYLHEIVPQPHIGSPTEKSINELLSSLLSGTYRTTCMLVLRRHILPSEDTPSDPAAVRKMILTALGGLRTLRNSIRRVLSARLARTAIERESRSGYSHSGAPSHVDIAESLIEGAWPPAGTGWEPTRFGKPLSSSARAWVAFSPPDEQSRELVDRLLDDIASTLKDILAEVDDRDEDSPALSREEAGTVGQTLYNLVEYLRPLKSDIGTPYIVPLALPSKATTPFLRTLTALLTREHTMELQPLLSQTLLHVADNLSDSDTARLPAIMTTQNDLTPISPEWIENWGMILRHPALVSSRRPLTRKAVMKTLKAVHESICDMPRYRRPLGDLVLEACKRVSAAGDGDDCDTLWNILAQEVVAKTAEGSDESGFVDEAFELLVSTASGRNDVDEEDIETASVATAGTHSSSPAPHNLITPATMAAPVISRAQTDSVASSPVRERESVLPSMMSSMISTFTSANVSRMPSFQPPTPEVHSDSIETPSPPVELFTHVIADVGAVRALIYTFSQLVFTPHALEAANLAVAVTVFRYLLQLLKEARSAKVRIAILQFLMRLRADRDHRLYFMLSDGDAHGLAAQLGGLIQRVTQSPEAHLQSSLDAVAEVRTARPRLPRQSRGRGGGASGSGASRSRSRLGSGGPPTALPPKPLTPLWSIPETLPFDIEDADTPSESLILFDPNSAENGAILPISLYLTAIDEILQKETNWEVLSYVLVHLPNQLANKHMFCGPKSRKLCSTLLKTLCSGILKSTLGSEVEQFPMGIRARDAQGLAFHTLSVLVGYQPCFEMSQQHMLVEVFLYGLDGTQPATIKCCLHALTLAAFELPTSMTKYLSQILQKVSQIMTSADMTVHILGFLSIVGSLRPLYANFNEKDFKIIFGVALQYLQHQNANRDEPTVGSWALSEHVRILSYYIVYVWFLALKVPDRKTHVPYISRQLFLANEKNETLDGPTEVCFDWLERYTYASADPRPATSLLSEIVMNPSPREDGADDVVSEKTWLNGDSFMTVKTLRRRGWFEILSRRPSGYTKLLCRLENAPMVGPGDVDPDVVSVPAAMIMDSEPPRVQATDGDEAQQNGDADLSEPVHELLDTSPPADADLSPPDPLQGYVWSKTAPSQRRKQVEMDPAFIALQLSDRQNPNTGHRLIEPTRSLTSSLALLDLIPVIDTHKVGIMYVAPGQHTEREILGNTHGSPAYTRFLEGIGRLINLRGQVDVYAGGLNPDQDGEYAYAWWDDIGQVLYHTATMMPNHENDPHFNYKKAHIGNDYVRIVWNDSGKPYRFDTLQTQFQFVNIVIEPHSIGAIAAFSDNIHENEYFKLTVQRAPNMPDFAPVGAFKLISAKNLPVLVRQLSLLADWFASVYANTHRDTERVEIKTNWHSRLDHIRQFRSRLPKQEQEELKEEDKMRTQQRLRDFTSSF